MKRIINQIAIFSLLSPLSFFLSSCLEDNYESGEGEYSQLRADLVDAHVASDKFIDYVLTDEGDSLRTKPQFSVNWMEKTDTLYRALLYFNLKDGAVEGVSIGPVLVPSIRPAGSFKGGMKTDPVHLTSLWLAQTGRYLNLRMSVMTGSLEGVELEKQVFGCASDTLITHADGRSTLHLRLYHDQGGQPEFYSREVYLSVPLKNTEADTLLMHVDTYEGVFEKRLALKH